MKLDTSGANALQERHNITFFPKLTEVVGVEGADAPFEPFTQHLPGRFMPLGAYSYAHSFFPVARIGRYCSIGADVSVMGESHPLDWLSSSPVFYRSRRARIWGSQREEFPPFDTVGPPVEIENDVWIGDGVLLNHGVRLGTGCVVASRAIVTRDIPPYAIVAGAPARVVRLRFDEAIVERLLESEWWTWPVSAWDGVDTRDTMSTLARAEELWETMPQMREDRVTARALIQSIVTDAAQEE